MSSGEQDFRLRSCWTVVASKEDEAASADEEEDYASAQGFDVAISVCETFDIQSAKSAILTTKTTF